MILGLLVVMIDWITSTAYGYYCFTSYFLLTLHGQESCAHFSHFFVYIIIQEVYKSLDKIKPITIHKCCTDFNLYENCS